MVKPTLYLIRGLPGSGKTTLGQMITLDGPLFEADQYFTDNGVYRYDPTKIADAHAWCKDVTAEAMSKDWSIVAVANTFTRQWEMKAYYELARAHGYQVVEITVKTNLSDDELAARNVHGVPAETIAKMRARWEP